MNKNHAAPKTAPTDSLENFKKKSYKGDGINFLLRFVKNIFKSIGDLFNDDTPGSNTKGWIIIIILGLIGIGVSIFRTVLVENSETIGAIFRYICFSFVLIGTLSYWIFLMYKLGRWLREIYKQTKKETKKE